MPRQAVIKYQCCRCGTKYDSLDNFIKSGSPMFIATGYTPICKSCVQKLLDEYVIRYRNPRIAMQRICMMLDLYYDDGLYDICQDDWPTFLGNYIKRLNMVQYRKKTFETSLNNNFQFGHDPVKQAEEDKKRDEELVHNRDLEKWGSGFAPVDYNILNSHYRLLKSANPNCDSNQEIFINDLCYTKMQQMKAVREGRVDDYSKLTESYRKTFQQAGLKTVKEEAKTSDDCWSTFTAIVSQYTPEEYYKDKTLYTDWDKLGEYYERMAVRPLRNLQLGTDERDSEYYVHDSEED